MHELFQHIRDIRDVLQQRVLAWNINCQNELLLSCVSDESELIISRYNAAPRWTHQLPELETNLWRIGAEQVSQSLTACALPIPHFKIQSVSGDGFLLTGSHYGKHRDGKVRANTFLIEADGSISSRFDVGDGVADMQTDTKDGIWVSYFDQGILEAHGNREPVGAPGLVRFDLKGHKTWKYHPPAGFQLMFDCYSLNVSGDATWVCYYTDFPVIRVSSDRQKVEGWPNKIHRGTRAIAAWDNYVLLAGGYQKNFAQATLLRLAKERTVKVKSFNLGFEKEASLLTGRGPYINYVNEREWWRLDIRDLI